MVELQTGGIGEAYVLAGYRQGIGRAHLQHVYCEALAGEADGAGGARRAGAHDHCKGAPCLLSRAPATRAARPHHPCAAGLNDSASKALEHVDLDLHGRGASRQESHLAAECYAPTKACPSVFRVEGPRLWNL